LLKSIVSVRTLNEGTVLSPERYDPRRKLRSTGRLLVDLVDIVRHSFEPAKGEYSGPVVVLDTGDADRGMVRAHGLPQPARKVGSTKKFAEPRDVLISRLRPYLKQVAWVDESVAVGARLACSTEFFVLRAKVPTESIAFLVPLLLSEPVHRVLCAAQEGGHHPRFNQQTLEGLPISDKLFAKRHEISKTIENAIRAARRAETEVETQVKRLSRPG
jgi:hypothetical protein